ncbi:ABC-type sugar transport system permease subunit [Anaerotaenia torta]
MIVNNEKSKTNKIMPVIIALLAVAAFLILLIPAFNPMRFLSSLGDWTYLHFLGNAMQVDKLFTASFPGIREFFGNNAIAVFCGFIIGIFVIAQLIGGILVLADNSKLRARGLLFLMIFSALNFVANLVIVVNSVSANSSAVDLGYADLGIHYEIPVGTVVFMLLAVAQFIVVKLYRRRVLIERNLYIKMTHREKVENLKGFAFISPYIIGFTCFTAFPLIFSFFSSFTYYNITAVQKWYGVNNFVNLFVKDDYFLKSLYNTVWYVVVSVPAAIVFAMLFALLMNMKSIKGLRFFRTVYYLPSVLSGVAVFLLWQWVLDPGSGLVNNGLALLGIRGPAWLYDAAWTKPALVLMKIWGVGGSTIILLSALQSVPQELYEASAIDGATGFRKFFHITLPMISPTLFFVMVTGVSGAFQVFDSAYIMMDGKGGPNNSLLFYNVHLFNTAMKDQQMGVASAMAWILFAIIMVFTVIQMIGSRKWVHYEGGSDKK